MVLKVYMQFFSDFSPGKLFSGEVSVCQGCEGGLGRCEHRRRHTTKVVRAKEAGVKGCTPKVD
jgi:hypothetical protein